MTDITKEFTFDEDFELFNKENTGMKLVSQSEYFIQSRIASRGNPIQNHVLLYQTLKRGSDYRIEEYITVRIEYLPSKWITGLDSYYLTYYFDGGCCPDCEDECTTYTNSYILKFQNIDAIKRWSCSMYCSLSKLAIKSMITDLEKHDLAIQKERTNATT